MKWPDRLQWFPVLWLTAVWVLLWGELTPANVLSGLALAVGVLLALPLPRIIAGVRLHPWPFIVLISRFLVDVVVASLQVAWLSVRPGAPPRSSVVTTRMETHDELLQTVVAEIMSLVPGAIIVQLDSPNRLVTMHVLGVATPAQAEEFRRNLREHERRVLRALAAPSALPPAPAPSEGAGR